MQKMTTIKLLHVRYMPKTLEAGVLYFSEEFDSAVHLCACGCGSKISTPIGPAEWTLEETEYGPTLGPSVGNWQHACQSHYWIRDGRIIWSTQWSSEQIAAGRRAEQERRQTYFDSKRRGLLRRAWHRVIRFLGY